jgi:hypothetical protein
MPKSEKDLSFAVIRAPLLTERQNSTRYAIGSFFPSPML